MKMARLIVSRIFLPPFLVIILCQSKANAAYNVISFGARPDGRFDSTPGFLKAWAAACSSVTPATIDVPQGLYLIRAVVFRGPCRSGINVHIQGTLVAPTDYRALSNSGNWILFIQVNRVSVFGGTLDAKGAAFWACRRSDRGCSDGATSITFNWANDIIISGLTSINSQQIHMAINSCKNVMVRNVKIISPDQSLNTDGIHVRASTGVTITGSTLKTGDDCISIGPGTRNLWMERIQCGPGHGISIGSLGREFKEDGVENVTLTNSVFVGSDNGVRIKSWARPSTGFVRNINYRNIIMRNVQNPIIIDQNYCPNSQGCPNQSSGVRVSQVSYTNIQGTSATAIAMKFDCSPTNPCRGIKLRDIKLTTYLNQRAQSFCKNSGGSTSGVILPYSCL